LDIQTKVQLLPLIKNIFLFLSHLLAKVSKEPAKIGHFFIAASALKSYIITLLKKNFFCPQKNEKS
jgi:hypothetical protein